MGQIFTEEMPYVKEMAKHEQFQSKFTLGDLRPGNPYQFRPYPMMLYKAHQLPNGKMALSMDEPSRMLFREDLEWARACQEAERFAPKCQVLVDTDRERDARRADGWRDNPTEALAYVKEMENWVATAAAERHDSDRKMGELARAEAQKFDEETFGHQAVIPEKRKPGRPKRVVQPAN